MTVAEPYMNGINIRKRVDFRGICGHMIALNTLRQGSSSTGGQTCQNSILQSASERGKKTRSTSAIDLTPHQHLVQIEEQRFMSDTNSHIADIFIIRLLMGASKTNNNGRAISVCGLIHSLCKYKPPNGLLSNIFCFQRKKQTK